MNDLIKNQKQDLLNDESILKRAVFQFIESRCEIICPIIYNYSNIYYIPKNKNDEFNQLYAEMIQMAYILNIYYYQQMEELLDQLGYKQKIDEYINKIDFENITEFNYVIKGIPAHYIVSIDSNPMVSIPAIGFHNIFFQRMNLPKNAKTWLTICYYNDDVKKQLINDVFSIFEATKLSK